MKILLVIVSLCIFLSEVSPSNDDLESFVKEMDSTPNVEEVSKSTVWKFRNFPATLILREINY